MLSADTLDGSGTQILGSTTVNFMIVVEDEPVSASIVGGSSRKIPLVPESEYILEIDASTTNDPSYPAATLEFQWNLFDISAGVFIPLSGNEPKFNLSTGILKVDRTYR